MFISKRHIPRRTVLRGLGATVALPLLDAMVPAATAMQKTAAAGKTRLAAIEMVHGAAGCSVEGLAKNLWSPAKDGADFEFSPSLAPLEPFRDYVTIISDTDLANAEALTAAERGGDHNRSSAVFLTASHPKQTEGSDILAGPSIDQIYAQKHGQDTALPSIQLCIENVGSISGACGYGYSCVYSNAISWASPTMPLPMERDPRAMFESLFGQGATAAERAARRREGLQHPRRRARDGCGSLNAGPRSRAIARGSINISMASGNRAAASQRRAAQPAERSARELPDAPIGVPDSFEEHVEADVRSAGSGICDGSDARVGVQDGPRRQPARISRRAASRRRSIRCRITATSPRRSWSSRDSMRTT